MAKEGNLKGNFGSDFKFSFIMTVVGSLDVDLEDYLFLFQ